MKYYEVKIEMEGVAKTLVKANSPEDALEAAYMGEFKAPLRIIEGSLQVREDGDVAVRHEDGKFRWRSERGQNIV